MKIKLFCLLIFSFGIALTITSCDNTLEPIDKEKGLFAIYGFLDLHEETNYIRVRDLKAPFTSEATQELDALVTLENLSSGTTQPLQSTAREHEGVFLHTFQVNGEIIPDSEYRLNVVRSDGATGTVNTRTPSLAKTDIAPLNQNCDTPIEIEFSPVNGGTIVMRLGFQIGILFWVPAVVLNADINNPRKPITYKFTPRERLRLVPSTGRNLACNDMRDSNIHLKFTHYAPGFYEKIKNDPFDILQSTERFGALHEDSLTFPIDNAPVCPQDC